MIHEPDTNPRSAAVGKEPVQMTYDNVVMKINPPKMTDTIFENLLFLPE